MIITGIGSRRVPDEVVEFIWNLPLGEHTVRSGGAEGCDEAFEQTTLDLEIFVPWNGFRDKKSTSFGKVISLDDMPKSTRDIAYEIACSVHPRLHTLSRGAQLLHSRNVFQILGQNLEEREKSDLVICWTPDGANTFDSCTRKTGGTATAIKLASIFEIPVLNLYNEKDVDTVLELFNLW